MKFIIPFRIWHIVPVMTFYRYDISGLRIETSCLPQERLSINENKSKLYGYLIYVLSYCKLLMSQPVN